MRRPFPYKKLDTGTTMLHVLFWRYSKGFRKKMKLRFNELRDYFGTYLLNHGILEAEINLCQGRIPVDIFIRHYWSPKLKELGSKILEILEQG